MKLYILNEFKKFALRGNILDLAIGIIIGGAFNKLVTSLVEDLLMPFIGLFLGQINFSNLAITIGQSTIKYGSFIQSSVDFFIVSLSVFILVKLINMLHEEQIGFGKASVEKQQLKVLQEMRDILKSEE